jgi:hypothetical protein
MPQRTRIEFLPLRFEFIAKNPIFFPRGKAANVLRGALGIVFRRLACLPACENAGSCPERNSCIYARIFEPVSVSGPSGLADSPRPFVFRTRHLEGRTIEPGQPFWFGLNLFLTDSVVLREFVRTFAEIGREGLGPHRSRVELVAVRRVAFGSLPEQQVVEGQVLEPAVLSLAPFPGESPNKIRVEFLTPIELKFEHKLAETPEFRILYARTRDRIGTLCRLYGPAPLSIDYSGTGERAGLIQMTSCQMDREEAVRRSSRTGQSHSIGGFSGVAEYEGALGEFLPYLEAALWTGVGRHAVWGLGEISWTPLP